MKRLLFFWIFLVFAGTIIFFISVFLTRVIPIDGSQLLFHSYLSGGDNGGDLYLYDVEHQFQFRITPSERRITESKAVMSPDHHYIALSEHSGTMGIWGLMEWGQTNSTKDALPLLWNNSVTYWGKAAWSPKITNGVLHLAFSTNQAPDIDFHDWRYSNIWVVDVPIKKWQPSDVLPASPSNMIPPLGQAIMATQHRLTGMNANDGDMAWSPDGRQMAFISDRDGSLDIYLVDTDGVDKNVRRVTRSVTVESSPSWSPDGQWLVFAAKQDTHSQLYIISASGGERRQLTSDLFENTQPSWSPDGRYIVYLADDFITLIRPDGSDMQQLFMGGDPAWMP